MRVLNTGHFERNCIQFGRFRQHFGGLNIYDLSLGINKAFDQPGAGDPVDLQEFSRDMAYSKLIKNSYSRVPQGFMFKFLNGLA